MFLLLQHQILPKYVFLFNHLSLMYSLVVSLYSFHKVLSSTSGVFEKAKQFVCRVFGGGSSTSSLNQEEVSNKRLIDDANSVSDNTKRTKCHTTADDLQFQPTSISLSASQSYTSIITKSPPPSPIQSIMVTQIHSILDNIDSVLDKIEAQTNSAIRRPVFNENYSPIQSSNIDILEELPNRSIQRSTDQITQTAMNIIEHHLNLNDGSGDTTLEYLDIVEDSSSIISYESNDSLP